MPSWYLYRGGFSIDGIDRSFLDELIPLAAGRPGQALFNNLPHGALAYGIRARQGSFHFLPCLDLKALYTRVLTVEVKSD